MTNDVLRELETWLRREAPYLDLPSDQTKPFDQWADVLSALLREREWRPIETAPKDGTAILVGNRPCALLPDGRSESAYWEPLALNDEGAWICITEGELCACEFDHYDVWQPLPAPSGCNPSPGPPK